MLNYQHWYYGVILRTIWFSKKVHLSLCCWCVVYLRNISLIPYQSDLPWAPIQPRFFFCWTRNFQRTEAYRSYDFSELKIIQLCNIFKIDHCQKKYFLTYVLQICYCSPHNVHFYTLMRFCNFNRMKWSVHKITRRKYPQSLYKFFHRHGYIT